MDAIQGMQVLHPPNRLSRARKVSVICLVENGAYLACRKAHWQASPQDVVQEAYSPPWCSHYGERLGREAPLVTFLRCGWPFMQRRLLRSRSPRHTVDVTVGGEAC